MSVGAARDRHAAHAANPLHATALLGVASVIAIVSGVVTSKIAAVLIGPSGVGYLAVVQGTINVIAVLGGLGVSAGLVRLTAGEIGAKTINNVRRNRAVAFAVTTVASALWFVGGLAVRHRLARLLFPDHQGTSALVLVLLSGALYAWTTTLVASFTAERRTTAYVIAVSLGALTTPLVSAVLYPIVHANGVPVVQFASNVASLLCALVVIRRIDDADAGAGPGAGAGAGATGPADGRRSVTARLLRFGGPQALATLGSLSSLFIVPVIVEHKLSSAQTGLFKAALTMALGYATIVTIEVTQGFFPRVSAATVDERVFAMRTNRELRLVATVMAVFALLGSGTAHYLTPVLYSRSFLPAVTSLRWFLAAELVKIIGFVLALAVSAYAGSLGLLLTNTVAAVATVGLTSPMVDWWGLRGSAIAYFAGQVLYLVAAVVIARRWSPFRFESATVRLLAVVAAAVIGLTLLSLAWAPAVRLVAAVVITACTAGAALALARPDERAAVVKGIRSLPRLLARVLRRSRRSVAERADESRSS